MATTTGTRRAHKHSAPRSRSRGLLPHLGSLVLGSVLSAAAWLYLVGAAIDFGRVALEGHSRAWIFTLAASAGAVVSLILLLVLVTRVLRALGVISDYRPRRAGSRRRTH